MEYKKKTSAVKHKTSGNYCSGRPNKTAVSHIYLMWRVSSDLVNFNVMCHINNLLLTCLYLLTIYTQPC